MSTAASTGTVGDLRAWFEEAFLDEHSRRYERTQRFIMAVIFVSVVALVLETLPSIAEPYHHWFDVIEGVVVAIFLAEYLINIWVAPSKRKYVLGPWGIIDLLAVLPSLFLMLNITSVKVIRVLRVMRVLRILRVLKLAKVASHKWHERDTRGVSRMDLQIYFIALFCAVTLWSTLVYYAEHEQPNTGFTSIPAAMWWGIVTLTTTGYGDLIPQTPLGRIIAGCTMITGLALFGLLMNVIGEALHISLFGARDGEKPRAAEVTAVQAAAPPALSAQVACTCGEPLNPAWRVCPVCETPLPPAASPAKPGTAASA